jgi:hypothetical protein
VFLSFHRCQEPRTCICSNHKHCSTVSKEELAITRALSIIAAQRQPPPKLQLQIKGSFFPGTKSTVCKTGMTVAAPKTGSLQPSHATTSRMQACSKHHKCSKLQQATDQAPAGTHVMKRFRRDLITLTNLQLQELRNRKRKLKLT